jgi:hypothetical protein
MGFESVPHRIAARIGSTLPDRIKEFGSYPGERLEMG